MHNLTGTGTNIKFKAATDFTTGDTFTVNESAVTARSIDGSSLSTGDFVNGSEVFAILSGDLLTVMFRSYAGELAEISASLSNKADKLTSSNAMFTILDAFIPVEQRRMIFRGSNLGAQ